MVLVKFVLTVTDPLLINQPKSSRRPVEGNTYASSHVSVLARKEGIDLTGQFLRPNAHMHTVWNRHKTSEYKCM